MAPEILARKSLMNDQPMSFFLFDRPEREPSRLVGFAGNRLDRRSEKRDDQTLADALADPAARLMLVSGGARLLLKLDGGRFDPHFAPADMAAYGADPAQSVLLGFSADGPVLAAPAAIEIETLPDGVKAIDFRSIYVQGLLE
jgi:NAD+ diphosphatase